MTPERWLVCGGRRGPDPRLIWSTLTRLLEERGPPQAVIHGGARGTDGIAAQWARRRLGGDAVIREPVTDEEWHRFGKAAGPMRNQRMIDRHRPTLVIAFPGNTGTADMVGRAERAGLPVIVIKAVA